MDACCETTVQKYLGQLGRVYPIGMGQQQMIQGRSFGPCCDPAMADKFAALMVERYSTVRFRFQREVATGNLILVPNANNTTPSFFAVGGNDANAPTGIWGPVKLWQTNLFASGVPVDRGEQFLCFGHAIEFLGVFARGGQGVADADPLVNVAWAEQGSGAYKTRIFELMAGRIHLTARFINSNFQYDLGNLSDAPSYAGYYGAEQNSVGQPITNTFKPYQAVLLINARDESRQLIINTGNLNGTAFEDTLTIQDDPGNLTQSDLYVDVKLKMLGIPICDPNNPAICNVPSGPVQGDDVRRLIREEIAAALGGAGGQKPAGYLR